MGTFPTRKLTQSLKYRLGFNTTPKTNLHSHTVMKDRARFQAFGHCMIGVIRVH